MVWEILIRRTALAGAILLWSAATLLGQGQSTSARLSGTVTDSAGAAVPAAQVSISSLETGLRRQFVTFDSGNYSFPLLPAGKYEFRIEKAGFDVFVRQNIVLEIGQESTLNATLTIGKVSETLTVRADAAVLETGDANVSSDVTTKQALELPLNQRNVYGLVFLDSSVNNSAQYQTLNGPGNQGGVDQDISFFNFGGGRFGTTAFLLDGNWNAGGDWNGIIFVPSVDELAESRIQTTTFSPQFGFSMGNVVNSITKSGTNSFHGDAYEFVRNSDFDANNFFNNAAGLPRPAFRRNQFGATVGGPVYIPGLYRQRDKTFFFGAFEALRQSTPVTTFATVPTAAERTGDFSALGKPIYNPFSTKFVNGNPVRTPFANARIDPTLFNPVALKALSYYPSPNLPGVSNNFVQSGALPLTGTQYTVRIDHNLTDTQHFSARWSQKGDNDKTEIAPYLGTTNVAGPGFSTHNPRYNAVVSYTNSFSPSFLISVNAGYGHWSEVASSQGAGFKPSTLGLPTSLDNFLGSGPSGFPNLSVSGYSGLGSGSDNTATRSAASVGGDVTKIWGSHTLTGGLQFFVLQVNSQRSSVPSFSFGTDFTSDPASPGGTGDALASFLLGTANGGGVGLNANVASAKKYIGTYLNDEWKVNRKLTVNLGVRYDIQTAPTERFDRFLAWQPDVPNPISQQIGLQLPGVVGYAGHNGLSRGVYKTNYNNVAPRIGVAYTPIDRLVVRAGYGVFFIPAMPLYPPVGPGFSPNTPYVGSVDGYTPLSTISNPFPNGYVQPTGTSAGPLTDVGQNISVPAKHHPTPYLNQWTFGLQYQLKSQTVLQADYVGNHGVKLDGGNFNLAQLNPQYLTLGNALLQQVPNPFYGSVSVGLLSSPTVSRGLLLQPYPQFAGYVGLVDDPFAASWYEALKLTAKQRFSNGVQFLASYTWSKYLDTATGPGGWASHSQGPRNFYDTSLEKSYNDNDIPQSLVLSYIIELPVGKGKKIEPPKALNAIVGGWQLSGISTFKKGFPLNITSNAPSTTLFGGTAHPNLVSDPKPANQTIAEWIDPKAFAFPAPFTFGNAPRTLGSVRAPGFNSSDISLAKNLGLWNESSRLQFRAEFFNIFNQTNFYAPDSNVGDAGFGVISIAYPSRSIQLALKLYW